jgi:D-alanyl-D-alanine carboxypeptidase
LKNPPTNDSQTTSKTKPIHFPYQQALDSQLMIIASYAQGKYQRFESLDIEAGKALMQMIYTARDDGVWIIPVSAFRTYERQKRLYDRQVAKYNSASEAQKRSAPPGHSEHHTGFAVDLTAGEFSQYPDKYDISKEFGNTEAYQWLLQNASRFGFELSFPENNAQGVSYEPWHWRYVGSSRARETFAKARNY